MDHLQLIGEQLGRRYLLQLRNELCGRVEIGGWVGRLEAAEHHEVLAADRDKHRLAVPVRPDHANRLLARELDRLAALGCP